MSEFINTMVTAINAKLGDDGFDSSVKLNVKDEGCVVIDDTGARAADDDTACTLVADKDTFNGLFDGSVNAMQAVMGGKLAIEGDMSVAMKLGKILG
ncbi:MAG: SCP2 sterol-binding domain-containing protein [Burkholderiaceae bacterium]